MKLKNLVKPLTLLIFLLSGTFAAFADVTEEPLYNKEKIGVIVIDVQSYYIPFAKDQDIEQTLVNIGKVMKTAGDYKLPFHITFEYATWKPVSEIENHNKIPAELEALIPAVNSERYLKTGFDSSKQAELIKDLRLAGLTKVVLVGAETDVCVLQTAMGLARKGFEVYLVKDAVYTSALYERPSFQRMAQGGIKFISTGHFENVIKNNLPLTADITLDIPVKHTNPHAIVDPNQTAILLVDYTQPAIDKAVNKSIKPMMDRVTIMLYEADSYRTPVYSVIDPAYGTGLPATDPRPKHLKEYEKDNKAVAKSIDNLTEQLNEREITQVFLAGSMDGVTLKRTVNHLLTLGVQVYILEDLIFSEDAKIQKKVQQLYKKGAIPMDYKMYKYGMFKGVSTDDAFSQLYITDFWKTFATGKVPIFYMLPPVIY